MKTAFMFMAGLLTCTSALAADPLRQPVTAAGNSRYSQASMPVLQGRVAVIDGRTLWFPEYAQQVRLADIDLCEIPQWAFNPQWANRALNKAPPPVPCGALAKAWLKRNIGTAVIRCSVTGYDHSGIALAHCTKDSQNIALEMLRTGWARVSAENADPVYMQHQTVAMAARYGMWATYVLDMNEWRRKAVDKTAGRQPIADFNLLAERKSEISPAFSDVRRKPLRTDR